MKAKRPQYLNANVLVGRGGSGRNCRDAAMATAFYLHLLFRRTLSSPGGASVKRAFALLIGRRKADMNKAFSRASARKK